MDVQPSTSASSSVSADSGLYGPSRPQRIRQLCALISQLPSIQQQCDFLEQLPDDPDIVAEVRTLLGVTTPPALPSEPSWIHEPQSGLTVESAVTSEGREDDLQPGARVGSYEVVRLIGRGGMGVVYEAIQNKPRRRVALKLLRHELKTDVAVARFMREAELLGRLRHPGMAQIYEAGVEEVETEESPQSVKANRPYFALELSHGQPVTSYALVHQIGNRDTAYLVWRLCDAVAYAHRKNVVHLDLKPSNILVDPFGHPKILDFGVARAIDHGREQVSVEEAASEGVGLPCGTIPYMSPEQARGDVQAIDGQSDVFSLGVILFELLAGRPPIDPDSQALSDEQAIRAIQEMPPLARGSLRGACEPDLEAIVRKAIHPEKAQRYPEALDMADDLDRYLNDEPVVAMGQSPSYRFAQFTRRRRPMILLGAAAAIFGISTLVLGWIAYWQHVQLTAAKGQSSSVQSDETGR